MMWYGYMHVSGSIHLKRYNDSGDIDEARESDFVEQVYGPFAAKTQSEALTILKTRVVMTEVGKR